MVNITFKIPEKDDGIILRVKGHAREDIPGRDIVCASISTLVYLIAQRVKDMMDAGILEDTSKLSLEDGNAVISCFPKENYRNFAAGDFLMIQRGFELLEANYPEYIRIKEKLVTGKTA